LFFLFFSQNSYIFGSSILTFRHLEDRCSDVVILRQYVSQVEWFVRRHLLGELIKLLVIKAISHGKGNNLKFDV